jgi:hypothetical protein
MIPIDGSSLTWRSRLTLGLRAAIAAIIAVAFVVAAKAALGQSTHYRHRAGWILQDSVLTPGAVRTTDSSVICHGTTKAVRKTTEHMKQAVYDEYGIADRYAGQYEIDHLIPLELGGKDTVSNLWPEPAKPLPGYHQKDVLENWLHREICTGALSADSVQRWIVHDFPGAYRAMLKARRP